MGTVILVRHGRSTANREHVLAGRTGGIGLDDEGTAQATALAQRLADATIRQVVTSPLQRCRETVAPLAAARGLDVTVDERLVEVDYGDWTGRPLAELRREPLWTTVQEAPSAMVFPGGESLAAVSARGVAAARHYGADAEPGAVVLCSHGDVIGAIVADALGMHLDLFQRLAIAPGAVSVVHYFATRTVVERVGDTGSLAGVGAPPAQREAGGREHGAGTAAAAAGAADGEATVGGVTGA